MGWKNPFRRRKEPRPLEERVSELERRAASAPAGYRGQHLNRAGDLCAEAGDLDRAIHFWGQAIDAYLVSARPEAAAAMCRKVIRHRPTVVRARRTLALLAVGQGHLPDARRHLDEYVQAARAAGTQSLALKQLRLLGGATRNEAFRHHVGGLLRELGEDKVADEVETQTPGSGPGNSPYGDEADRWSAMLQAALMSPEQVRKKL